VITRRQAIEQPVLHITARHSFEKICALLLSQRKMEKRYIISTVSLIPRYYQLYRDVMQNYGGQSAFHMAAQEGHLKIARLLQGARADAESEGQGTYTAEMGG